ncbi:MAG: phosphatidate cytidylyltransferase [Alcanivorax sp.]|jgi:phosphatidate cytidylyltransferase
MTGVALASSFVAAVVFLPVQALAAVFAVIVSLGAWEWARLAGWTSPLSRSVYTATVVLAMVGLYFHCELGGSPSKDQVQPFLGLACLWWSFALLWIKSYPASAGLWGTVTMRSLMGVLILAPAWLAAVYLLSFPRGGLLMIAMILIVVTADVGAYFTGKSFGRHSLAVKVSPAKTWEGFWGGMASVLILALALHYWLPVQSVPMNFVAMIVIVLVTALSSVVGDLTVSMVKRQSDIKDAGSILPGHGGLLDRLDSICGAAPVFTLGLLLAGY